VGLRREGRREKGRSEDDDDAYSTACISLVEIVVMLKI
jgi:hypothetical protein